ncbi:MAG: hypothetical protein JNL92_00130 [Opitutaceae bacterium]|nr:hypothetical protein [Opitutaceae bacterium]
MAAAVVAWLRGRVWRALLCGVALSGGPAAAATAPRVEVLDVRRIWDRAPHNAFPDLVHWRARWWCSLREGDAHVGGADGAARVLSSADGRVWEPAARITETDTDLRDPRLSVMPDGRLMMVCGGSVYLGTKQLKGRRPRVLFSTDGARWTVPRPILSEGEWLWRVTWHDGVAYGTAFAESPAGPTGERALVLYRCRDGETWEKVVQLAVPGRPSEATLRFDDAGRMVAVVRREGGDRMGWLGRAAPPYTAWEWHPGNRRFGGPNLLAMPDGSWLLGTRDYAPTQPGVKPGEAMVLATLNAAGATAPVVTLPSGGDCSYPGLAWHEGVLWVAYYSSHEGKAAIYLARVRLNEP